MHSSQTSVRAPRVSAERLVELARHVTERDREIALCLYEQQLLATDQLTLLFFSSKRRAQDRLLLLYRERGSIASTRRRASAPASRRRTGCWTRRALSSSRPCSAWSASGSGGSGATTGA